jgi:hypothetical protein
MPDNTQESVKVEPAKAENASAADTAKKIPLKFRRKHIHNGKTYLPGETDKFTQAEADMIRKSGAVEMPPAPTDAERKEQDEKNAAALGLKQ